jgi:hypothetical protein
MAQHDYVIANGTGAAVRSDLNGSLAAIVSNNSGATEPGTMYAYQWWADTTTGLLKIRNAANNAWVTVGTLASTNLGLLPLAGGTITGNVDNTATGYFDLPSGTTAQRPGSPNSGWARFNTDTVQFEGYTGTLWSSIGGGAKGGGSDSVFFENDQTVTTNYTLTTNKNAVTAGPCTINSGVTVTIPSGSSWVVV